MYKKNQEKSRYLNKQIENKRTKKSAKQKSSLDLEHTSKK
jgi:hypothetical protein